MKPITQITLFLSLVFSQSCLALPDTFSCHGFDQYDNSVEVFIDRDVETARINGEFLYISSGKRGMNIITTDNFYNENGRLVYDSILLENNYVRINQYDAKLNDFLVTAELCCRKHLDN